MNTNTTIEKMKRLRLKSMADIYYQTLRQHLYTDYSLDDYLGLLVDTEWEARQNRQITNLIAAASFRQTAAATDIDYTSPRNLDKNNFERLLSLDFLHHHENIIIEGLTGTGKSFLAQSLGVRACQLLHRTCYFTCSRFFDQGKLARLDGSYPQFFKRLHKAELLILDDFGLNAMDNDNRKLLMDVIDDRYERASTIITAQVPVANWHSIIGEGTIADAVLDRIVFSSHRIELNGPSLRKNKKIKSF
jgi:DNA replication protein DnaC